MAVINYYTKSPESSSFDIEVVLHDGSVISWILENINDGENFQVYVGELDDAVEISRDLVAMDNATNVSVFITPAGDPFTIALIVSVIVSVAVTLLTPKPDALDNVNRQQESPNNSLSNRKNVARPNQRIVDVGGKIKSIPDIIQNEFSRYVANIEERIGYYCIARNQVQVEDVKDGDSLISDVEGESAGIYYPFKSPNNASPDIQIGDPINEPVVGVYQSSDAISQTLNAPNDRGLTLTYNTTFVSSVGYVEDLSGDSLFDTLFSPGDSVTLNQIDVVVPPIPPGTFRTIGENTHTVIASTQTRITFDITEDPSWDTIPGGFSAVIQHNDENRSPTIRSNEIEIVGKFRITSVKIDRLLVNVAALSGMYRENSGGRQATSVTFRVVYQKLSDTLQPVGPETPVDQTITGRDATEKGGTIDIDLGGLTYVEYFVYRVNNKDYSYNGNIVDEIKLKDVFGLFSVDKTDFGNVTTIQTKRKSLSQTTAIKTPELNCIATEMVNEYQGLGVFDPALTPNEKGMQTLIRMALDDRIGRRTEAELDLDLLLSVQNDVDSYFPDEQGGTFNYSFDSTKTTAQETFYTICNAMFCIPFRDGRVLKAFFEKPQLAPAMVFTHRSKRPNSETWNTDFPTKKRKDSIEFKYIDADLYTQETLYFPEDRTGTNPLKLEISGIKGLSQATWRMMREYNKLIYQNVSVDFTATQEGRFVKPQRMISVVKGSRVASFDGYIRNQVGLLFELSQDVEFTTGDDHFIILKRRDGTTESIPCFDIGEKRVVQLGFFPTEDVYTGNSERETEFSFGNEARLEGQLLLPQEINASDNQYVKIKAINYSALYYKDDPTLVEIGGFDIEAFSDGYF